MPDYSNFIDVAKYAGGVVTSAPSKGVAFINAGARVAVGVSQRVVGGIATGHTFDGTSDALDEQTVRVHTLIGYVNKCSASPTHISKNESQKQEEYRDAETRKDDMKKFIADQNLLWEVNRKLEEEGFQKTLKE